MLQVTTVLRYGPPAMPPEYDEPGNTPLGTTETTPLLKTSLLQIDDFISQGQTLGNQSEVKTRCQWPWLSVVALVIATAIVSDIGEDLYGAPRLRLFEAVICKRYYVEHDPSLIDPGGRVDERHCKVDGVQDSLAELLGWVYFSNSVPAILLPIPFGYLADKYGRKWILVMAMMGSTASYALPLYLVSRKCRTSVG